MSEREASAMADRLHPEGVGAAGRPAAPGAGKLDDQDHKDLLAAVEKGSQHTAMHLQKMVEDGKMTAEQANKRLNELHPSDWPAWMGFAPMRTLDDHTGKRNHTKGIRVGPDGKPYNLNSAPPSPVGVPPPTPGAYPGGIF